MFKILIEKLFKYYEILRTKFFNLEKNQTITNINNIFSKIKFLDKYFNYFLVITLITFFIIFKLNFKTGLGGDDSRIYMFYPTRIYELLSQRILESYPNLARMNLINTMYVFSILEKLGFGYQEFYFIIFILGFLFAYLSFKEILVHYNLFSPLSKYFILFLSLLYVSNPLMADQAWNNHYLSIFTISGIPLLFLIFLKITFNQINFTQMILLNLIASSLSAFFLNAPQILAFAIAAGTIALIYLLLERKNFIPFILNSIIFLILFILININWINSLLIGLKNTATVVEGYKDISVTKSIPLLDFGWAESFNNFNYLFLNHVNPNSHADFFFYVPLILFGLVIIYSIIFNFFNLFKVSLQNIKTDSFQFSLLISLIIIGYLQSIALTKVGQIIFSHIVIYFSPLYSFRNYMNKIPAVYSYVLLSFILVAYIKIPKKFEGLKLVFIAITILFTISSYRNLVLLEDYRFNQPEGYVRATKFDDETLELIDYIKSTKSKRTTYLPLSNSPYSIIKNEKELYAGLSPFIMFLEIDDLNGTFYFGDNASMSYIDPKYLANLDYERLLTLYNYLGVNKIIVNNDLDLDRDLFSAGIYNSDDNKNFNEIKKEIKNKNELEFETKNKKYSVYTYNQNDIVFKKNIIKVDKSVPSYNFFKLDFANNTMSFENNLKEEFFNFLPVETKAFNISDEKNITKFYDSELNLVAMDKINPVLLYENSKHIGNRSYYIKNDSKNILRIVSNIPRDDLKISATRISRTCLRNIFNKSDCKVYKDPYKQRIGENFSYTFDLGTESIFSLVNISQRNDSVNMDILDLQFYLGSNNKLDSEAFTQKDKDEYLKNLFTSNPAAYSYQIPQVIEYQKINNYEYKVKLNLKESGMPFILVLKDLLSDGWVLTGKGITDKTKFNSDIQFNGWVVFPDKDVSTMEITLKHQLNNTKSQFILMISDYSTKLSIMLLLLISIYGVTKTIIRKYRR